MEYLGSCPKCDHHTIINKNTIVGTNNKTVKPKRTNMITQKKHVIPKSKVAKCINCHKVSRINVIGEVEDNTYMTSANPEFATHNNLTLRFW